MGCKINNLQFNQDNGCFTSAMDSGVSIYNTEPLVELMHLDSSTVGSISVCEMLNRTNVVGMVGGGNKPKFAENTVLLWDDAGQQFVSELTLPSTVLSIKIRRDRIYVALHMQIHVYSFPGWEKLLFFATGSNPKGLLEVSPFPSSERQLLIFPDKPADNNKILGRMKIIDLKLMGKGKSADPITILAHESEISYIALNQQATLVATASLKGTLIRIFDSATKPAKTSELTTPLVVLRRGADSATLYCINFSSNSNFLCASSDKGTVHIFDLKDSIAKRCLLGIENWSRYIVKQRSFATFSVTQDCKCICAFGSDSSVYAACTNGTFYKYVYSENGNCNRESYDVFLDLDKDDEF